MTNRCTLRVVGPDEEGDEVTLPRCGCGALQVVVMADTFRQAAGLVSSYLHGDEDAFSRYLVECRPSVVVTLVEQIHCLLSFEAEDEGVPIAAVLERFCLASEYAAQHPFGTDPA